MARQLGVHQSTVNKAHSEARGAGRRLIEAMIEYGIRSEFFFDASLGEEPNHRDYLTKPTKLERDAERSLYPAVETYLSDEAADERPPVSEQHARELREVRYSGEVTVGMVGALHREMIARDKGKTGARGEPIGPKEIPEGKRLVIAKRGR